MVVKKEQEGFGFTLSKEMPVFVNSVSPGSSADRAGILSGDRIIKVTRKGKKGRKGEGEEGGYRFVPKPRLSTA